MSLGCLCGLLWPETLWVFQAAFKSCLKITGLLLDLLCKLSLLKKLLGGPVVKWLSDGREAALGYRHWYFERSVGWECPHTKPSSPPWSLFLSQWEQIYQKCFKLGFTAFAALLSLQCCFSLGGRWYPSSGLFPLVKNKSVFRNASDTSLWAILSSASCPKGTLSWADLRILKEDTGNVDIPYNSKASS